MVVRGLQGGGMDCAFDPGLKAGTELSAAACCLAVPAEFGEDKLCDGTHPALANA